MIDVTSVAAKDVTDDQCLQENIAADVAIAVCMGI